MCPEWPGGLNLHPPTPPRPASGIIPGTFPVDSHLMLPKLLKWYGGGEWRGSERSLLTLLTWGPGRAVFGFHAGSPVPSLSTSPFSLKWN